LIPFLESLLLHISDWIGARRRSHQKRGSGAIGRRYGRYFGISYCDERCSTAQGSNL